MCRGGHMFAPTKTWRRWHRKININQKRYAGEGGLVTHGGWLFYWEGGGANSKININQKHYAGEGVGVWVAW